MFKFFFPALFLVAHFPVNAQLRWINMDSAFGYLPSTVHVYKTTDSLDGDGSSCMLLNGKETIKPSDKKQRAVPVVFMIKKDKYSLQ